MKSDLHIRHYYSKRLLAKLEAVTASPAVIVEAPSGSGKTTAVRDYLKKNIQPACDVRWFTAVDEAPASLYQRLCAEIGKIDGNTGKRLREIDFPNAFTVWEAFDTLSSLKCERETWLVIDNFHYFTEILPPTFLLALLDHGRDGLHVVIITQPLGRAFSTSPAGSVTPRITAEDFRWDARDIARYCSMAGAEVPQGVAEEIRGHTDGWVIAVYLQARSYMETGAVSGEAVLSLMENLIWNKLSEDQRILFMKLSYFDSYTEERIAGALGCETLPDYAADILSVPFVRYAAERRRYEPHALLLELIRGKRRARGRGFEAECLAKAGDVLRDEGNVSEALSYYAQIRDYDRMLSMDFFSFVCSGTGDVPLYEAALDIAVNCPADIYEKYPLSMLRVAWAVRLYEKEQEFAALMEKLDAILPDSGPLRAEWRLLCVYLRFPRLTEMLNAAKVAAESFRGEISRVVLSGSPWAFFDYLQLTAFHFEAGEADRDADALEEFIETYSRMTGGHGRGADALYRSELAYLRGEVENAEVFAYKAFYISEENGQKTIQIGAARMLAEISLLKSDSKGWQRAVSAIERAASGPAQNAPFFRAALDLVRGSLLAELRDYRRIADWIKDPEKIPAKLPKSVRRYAMSVHMIYLAGMKEYARLVGFGQTISLEGYSVFSYSFQKFLMAVGYTSLGDRAQAEACVSDAAKRTLPDRLIHYFAGFSRLMQGLPDEFMKSEYPDLLPAYEEYKRRYDAGWHALHTAMVADELPEGLTLREREIAKLAAEGMHNGEIASTLFVSENTVRAHLRSIYSKLDIDRRAKLAEKLK